MAAACGFGLMIMKVSLCGGIGGNCFIRGGNGIIGLLFLGRIDLNMIVF
jgi:hypothetical protein